MKVNIIRLQDNELIREQLDTTLFLSIEFMLDDKHSVTVRIENSELYISSFMSKLKITPHASNAVSIGVIK